MKRFRLNFFNLGLLLLASIGISMYLNKSIKEALAPMGKKALRAKARQDCKRRGKRGRAASTCRAEFIKTHREEEQTAAEAARKKVVKKEEKNDCGPAVASIKKKFCDLKL
jgi:hypothetical protein